MLSRWLELVKECLASISDIYLNQDFSNICLKARTLCVCETMGSVATQTWGMPRRWENSSPLTVSCMLQKKQVAFKAAGFEIVICLFSHLSKEFKRTYFQSSFL